jgi:hypothetical protein
MATETIHNDRAALARRLDALKIASDSHEQQLHFLTEEVARLRAALGANAELEAERFRPIPPAPAVTPMVPRCQFGALLQRQREAKVLDIYPPGDSANEPRKAPP